MSKLACYTLFLVFSVENSELLWTRTSGGRYTSGRDSTVCSTVVVPPKRRFKVRSDLRSVDLQSVDLQSADFLQLFISGDTRILLREL